MLRGMDRAVTWPLTTVVALAAVAALAAPAAAQSPEVGQPWPWPTIKDWVEGAPSGNDAAGKVVVHWFCKPKVADCPVDLARVYNLRELGNVYVIAYIDGTRRDAGKLDPVRGEVGAGGVAYGKGVKALFKAIVPGGALPMSVVVDVDGKVAHVSYTGDPDQLDARDQKVRTLIGAIKIFTVATTGPTRVKPGERFELAVKVDLAPWLAFDQSLAPEVKLRLPPDLTCDATTIKGDGIKLMQRSLTATVGCKGAVKGSYEASGSLRFSYRAPSKAIGVGEDAVRWRFAIAP